MSTTPVSSPRRAPFAPSRAKALHPKEAAALPTRGWSDASTDRRRSRAHRRTASPRLLPPGGAGPRGPRHVAGACRRPDRACTRTTQIRRVRRFGGGPHSVSRRQRECHPGPRRRTAPAYRRHPPRRGPAAARRRDRSRDRLGEDRRVRGGAADGEVAHEPREVAGLEQLARRVSSQIETPASCKRCSRFIAAPSVSCRCRSTFGLLAFGADPHDVPGEVAALQTADEPGAGIELQAAQAVTG
jgi:hypothetical protein